MEQVSMYFILVYQIGICLEIANFNECPCYVLFRIGMK